MHTIKITNNRAAPDIYPRAVKDGVPGGFLTLVPGVNDVPLEEWRALADPAKGLARRQLVTRTDAPEFAALAEHHRPMVLVEGPITAGETLAGLTLAEAEKLLADTLDRRVLKRWREAEERADVRGAIDAAIAKLDAPGPAKGAQAQQSARR